MPRQARPRARYTGICRVCRHRVLITPVSGVIRVHLRLDGLGECDGGTNTAEPGTSRLRERFPPDSLTPGRQDEVTRRCLEFTCDVCLARVGQQCVTIVRRVPTTPHGNRHAKATAAGRLPIREDES